MVSKARSVNEYLETLPADRKEVVSKVRDVIRRNLPKGYQETMNWGMITYEVPLDVYPETYNNQPLGYVALAAQKNYFALYLTGVYQDSEQQKWLKQAFQEKGKKLDMGKSCLRFRKLDDLPLEVIGKIVKSTSVKKLIAQYETVRSSTKPRKKT